MSALDGSSVENRWILDRSGQLRLFGLRPTNPRTGQDSTSVPNVSTVTPVQDSGATISAASNHRALDGLTVNNASTSAAQAAEASVAGPIRRSTRRGRAIQRGLEEQAAHARRLAAEATRPRGITTSSAGTRVHRCVADTLGTRAEREEPLTHDNLYLDDARPPPLEPGPDPAHSCGICLGVNSHPARTRCGHTYCFICLRMALERDWRCPECRQTIHKAPVPDVNMAQLIAVHYPRWVDASRVTFTFDGLLFPQKQFIRVLDMRILN
ncbi:hypothetical protein DFH06DRAFT_1323328 [Mycena polygramma]|nr:hypothetical protein DFH06DRAFT_1323328 [Mycena polygramma]